MHSPFSDYFHPYSGLFLREPCGWWMIVVFMVVSFVVRCVDQMCQFFLSECLFFSHSSWPCHYGLLTFACLWEISFSSQTISGTVSWLLGLDRILIILVVRPRSWIAGVSVVDSFMFCLIYFFLHSFGVFFG